MANVTGLNFTNNSSSFNISPVDLPYLEQILYGNSIREYAVALIYFMVAVLILKLVSWATIKILEKIGKRSTSRFQEGVIDVLKALQLPLFIIIGIQIAVKNITLHNTLDKILDYLLLIIITYYVVRAVIFVVKHASRRFVERREKEEVETDTHLLDFFTKVIYGVLWIVAILFVASRFGIDVSQVLTGLGIAGIAVAFALQNVLSDVFASVSIYFDKPFRPGEYIIFEGEEGTVVKTGIKSTRIKTLRGEELSVSNRLLTDQRIHNMDRMDRRRIDVDLQVKYGTPRKKLEKIPKMLEQIVKKEKKAKFDRCHFKSFKEYSLEIELIYFVESNAYVTYMDVQQKINFAILSAFEKEKIEFAFPTSTVQLEEKIKKNR